MSCSSCWMSKRIFSRFFSIIQWKCEKGSSDSFHLIYYCRDHFRLTTCLWRILVVVAGSIGNDNGSWNRDFFGEFCAQISLSKNQFSCSHYDTLEIVVSYVSVFLFVFVAIITVLIFNISDFVGFGFSFRWKFDDD